MVEYSSRRGLRLYARYVRSLDRRDVSYLVALVVVGAYVYLGKLGAYTLAGWDEGVYATAAFHAVADGYWLVPHTYWISNTHDVTLTPFLHKPPLVVWSQALSMSVFGINTFAARLPSALAAVLTGVVVYAVGRRYLSRFAGFVGAIVWYTTPGVYAASNGGRFAATDTTLVFFGSLFVVLAWAVVKEDRPDLLVPTCLVAGLAVLAKGFAAGIFVLVVLPLYLPRLHVLRSREMAKGVLGFLLIVLPWPLAVTAMYGDDFVRQSLLQQVVGRASGSVGVSTGGGLFAFMRYPYFKHFFSLFDPWVYWLLPGIVALAVAANRRDDREQVRTVGFLGYWAAVVLGFYAVFGNHQWYIMPMYVPCALLVGWVFDEVVEGRAAALNAFLAGTMLLVLLSPRFAAVSPLAGNRITGLHGGVWSDVASGRTVAVLLLALVVVLGAIKLVRTNRVEFPAHQRTLAVAPTVVSLLLVATLITPPASMGTLLHNQYEMGTTARETVPEDETVYLQTTVPDATNLFPYEFYSRRAVASATRYDLYTDASIRYAIVPQSTLRTLRRPHEVLSKRKIQSGHGPKPLALVAFTGTFEEYRPTFSSVDATTTNRLTNPGFARGLTGWWRPTGDGKTVVRKGVVNGQFAAIMSLPSGANRLPLAQRVSVQKGTSYHVDVNATGGVDVALVWYDGAKRPANLAYRQTFRAADLPVTVRANGTQLAVRLRPTDSRAVVYSATVRRRLQPDEYVPLGPNVVRNGDFDAGLAEWWANPSNTGTQVTAREGGVRLRTPAGQTPLPIGQRVVVAPGERYLVDVETVDLADVVLVWFADGNASDPVSRDVIPAGETPGVVRAKTHLVAVRVVPAEERVRVESVSLHRTTTWEAWRDRTDDEGEYEVDDEEG